MKFKIPITVFLIWFSVHSGFAQKLIIGIENGINFSNSRNYSSMESTPAQNGPVSGVFAKFNLGQWLLIQSGVNYTSYHYKRLSNPGLFYPPGNFISSGQLFQPDTYYNRYVWNNSFLRIPLLLKFKTFGKLSFEMGGGVYYAFLTNDEFTGKDKIYIEDDDSNSLMPSTDWGWILATSVNYNINERFTIFVNGQATSGQKSFPKESKEKNGSTELTFGIGYNPFSSGKAKHSADTISSNIKLLPHTGINISKTKSIKDNNQYKSSVAFSSGLSIEFDLSDEVKFLSGVWYERKGHNLNYDGFSPFIYLKSEEGKTYSKLEADTEFDYLTFPLLLEFVSKTKLQFSLNLGVYYSLLQNGFVRGVATVKDANSYGFRTDENYFNYNLEKWVKSSDWGSILGLKLQYPVFSQLAVFVSVNQEWGIINLLRETDKDGNENPYGKDAEIRNRSLAIQFGLLIPLK